jgi:hypothetical protein
VALAAIDGGRLSAAPSLSRPSRTHDVLWTEPGGEIPVPRRVLIACPTYNAQVYAAFSHSLANTIRVADAAFLQISDYYPLGKTHCSARNDCVAQALNNGFDDLLFIDADQSWQAADLKRLISYQVDVVAAPVRKKSDSPERWNVYCPEGPESIRLTHGGLWTAPGMTVGTGFIRMSRKALVALWNASEPYREPDGSDCRWIYDIHPMEGDLVSEDVVVGHKLAELGFPTFLDPHMKVVHHDGMKQYAGDFVDFTRRLIAERAK